MIVRSLSEERNFRLVEIGETWLRRWNRRLAAFIAFLLFTSVFIVAIIEMYHDHMTISIDKRAPSLEPIAPDIENTTFIRDVERDLEFEDSNNCYVEKGETCIVHCSDILDTDIPSAVNFLNFTECTLPEINLVLDKVYFINNTIVNGWLSQLSREVQELTISSQPLSRIGESAFAGKPFDPLQKLVIEYTRIKLIERSSFLHSRLQSLEFRCENGRMNIEYDALGPISDYLTILQFSECIDDFQSVKNITGTGVSVYNKLILLDLRYNTFNKLLNNSFIDTPQLVSLYLSGNNIHTVEVGAFKGIQSSVQLLTLNNNKLTTLPNGVFDGFTRTNSQIDIRENPWNCNCDLQWLKEFYVKNLDNYFKNGTIPFTCTSGDYKIVVFCPEDEGEGEGFASVSTANANGPTTSTTTTTTTTTTTATTATTNITEDSHGYVYLECKDLNFRNMPLDGKNIIFSHSVRVRNGTIIYYFYQIKDTSEFDIKILSSGGAGIGSDYLIWINSKNSTDYGCVHNIQETVLLDNLHYGMSYTICLLKEAAETVAPFDCTSLTVPLEWENHAWILNKHIPVVIGGVVAVTVAIVLITSLIMFYTIRQNPKLIKGNKRIVIVRNKSADALVMPNYERQQYVPPSIYTNSEGYLTPRNKMYERINERRFRHLNTITEKFYKDFYNAPPRSSCPETLQRRSVGSAVYETPPLPPNHPSEKLKHLPHRPTSVYKH